jgi:hypothetical protein
VFGKYDSRKMALNMCDKKIIIFLGRFFVITLLIRSWPGDFLIGSCLIIFSISEMNIYKLKIICIPTNTKTNTLLFLLLHIIVYTV